MTHPLEIELKLEIDPARGSPRALSRALDQVRAALPAGGDLRRLVSVYYETESRALEEAGFVLRVRRDGHRRIQTLKAVGDGLFRRPEWEAEIAGDSPDLTVIPSAKIRHAVEALGALAPVFETRIERTTWRISGGSSDLELAFDLGEVVAGLERQSIREVEIELKAGSPRDMFDLASEIVTKAPVRIGVRSKSERGYGLLDSPVQRFVKGDSVILDADGTAGAAFQAVARACLRHFGLNEDGVVAHREPEALHQARVAMRRLRSAFTLFKDVIAGDECERLKRELRSVSRLLGEARNLDVYRDGTLEREADREPAEPGLAELAARIEADRTRAYDRIVRRLASKRFRLTMLAVMAFVEAGPWLDDDRTAKARERPAHDFAARVLKRRWHKLKISGSHLAELEPAARHGVRIEAKKLRYAAEFFASLYESGKAKSRRKAFVGSLEALQEALGDMNDIATGHDMARALAVAAADGDDAIPPTLLFAAGHMSGGADEREAGLLASAADAHRTLRHAKPFWT